MTTYSIDLRERVVAASEAGQSTREVAERFYVSMAFVRRLKTQAKAGESIEPKPHNGVRQGKLTSEQREQLLDWIRAEPGLTLEQLRARIAQAQGVTLSVSGVHRLLERLGWSYKKKMLHAQEQARPDVVVARAEYRERVEEITPTRLIFLDESGAATHLIRLYGRAPTRERCVDAAPAGHWQTTTMLTALRPAGPIEPASLVLPGAMNGVVFGQYIKEHLAPQLVEGDIVVMDNLNSHKVSGVREAIEARGAQLWYLPAYSPDFSPIEKLWSKVKAYLRQAAARTLEALTEAIGRALRSLSPEECANFYRSCGYAL